jgi:hypothetical protein
MREPRGKEQGPLGRSSIRVIRDWIDMKNGIDKEFYSKYTEKGSSLENEAIEAVKEYLDLNPFIFKNEESYENDYLTGTPDLKVDEDDTIIDIKISWEYWTFPYMLNTLKETAYDYQLQGYMDLTGYSKAKVVYVLMNTPLDLLDPGDPQIDYSNVPWDKRIKQFEVKKNSSMIDKIYEKVEIARDYISNNYDY